MSEPLQNDPWAALAGQLGVDASQPPEPPPPAAPAAPTPAATNRPKPAQAPKPRPSTNWRHWPESSAWKCRQSLSPNPNRRPRRASRFAARQRKTGNRPHVAPPNNVGLTKRRTVVITSVSEVVVEDGMAKGEEIALEAAAVADVTRAAPAAVVAMTGRAQDLQRTSAGHRSDRDDREERPRDDDRREYEAAERPPRDSERHDRHADRDETPFVEAELERDVEIPNDEYRRGLEEERAVSRFDEDDMAPPTDRGGEETASSPRRRRRRRGAAA